MNELRAGSARLRIVGLAVSAAFIAAVVWWAAHQRPPEFDASPAALSALVAAIGVYALNTLLRGERWQWLLRLSGGTPARTDSYALTAVGYMGNNVLPARAGDVMRVVLMSPRARLRRLETVGTMVTERVLDVAVLVALFVVVGYAVAGRLAFPDGRTILLIAAIAGALLVVATVGFALLRGRVRERLIEALRVVARSTLDLRRRHGAGLLALTVVIWAVEAGVWLLAGVAAGLELALLEGLYLVALASIFSLIPSGPGYAGTQDAAIVVGIVTLGGSGAQALAYLLLVRFVLVVPITLAGLALVGSRYRGWWRARRLTGLRSSA